MSQGDLESWVVAGSFVSRRDGPHTYEIGIAYSTQEYLGGNPAALAAVKDGTRNVGEIRATDRWAFSPGIVIEYGGRFAHHDYLDRRGLLSPRLALQLEPIKGTRVTSTAAQRMVAPGAEEFLTSTLTGPWLPPERTFAPLVAANPMREERARYVDLLVEHEFDGAYVVGVRRFYQNVTDQLATCSASTWARVPARSGTITWPVPAPSTPRAGGFDSAARSSGASKPRSTTPSRAPAGPGRGDLQALTDWAPAVLRPKDEVIHDVTASVHTEIPETATRVFVVYKLNSAFTRAQGASGQVGTDGRFEMQVHQALPFDLAGTRWELLVGVRNLFRDVNDPASVYDELLVVRPPTRVMGGFLVRF
jgi:hypothetical protein